MKVDDSGRIVEFAEKPKGTALDAMRVDTTALGLDAAEAERKPFMASMGCVIYLFLSSGPEVARRKESKKKKSLLLALFLFFSFRLKKKQNLRLQEGRPARPPLEGVRRLQRLWRRDHPEGRREARSGASSALSVFFSPQLPLFSFFRGPRCPRATTKAHLSLSLALSLDILHREKKHALKNTRSPTSSTTTGRTSGRSSRSSRPTSASRTPRRASSSTTRRPPSTPPRASSLRPRSSTARSPTRSSRTAATSSAAPSTTRSWGCARGSTPAPSSATRC